MITGFNTDIDYDGVTYHVQTEDKGLDTPLILSLVYVGGAILASKRSPYNDLIGSGFDEKALTERLQRQHKLICAAIRAGRIEDLKRMGEREAAPGASSDAAEAAASAVEAAPAIADTAVAPESELIPRKPARKKTVPEKEDPKPEARGDATKDATKKAESQNAVAPEAATAPRKGASGALRTPSRASRKEEPSPDAAPDGLYLNLLGENREFRAGEVVTIRIHASRSKDGRVPMTGASITLKVLGTTFRPVILPATTDNEGVAVVRTTLPRFTSGRAAILIRAVADGNEAELRRIIHQA